MGRASDAIGLAALRSPAPRDHRRPAQAKRPRRRRLRVHAGRFAFTAAILYLLGTGIAGEIQLLHVQAQEALAVQQLRQIQAHDRQLLRQIHYYRTPAGEQSAVQSVLHYVPKGETPLQFSRP